MARFCPHCGAEVDAGFAFCPKCGAKQPELRDDPAPGELVRSQEMQPAPKFVDRAESIAHICEIRGDRAGAAAAYREQLRLLEEDWGIVSGEEHAKIERAIQKLQ